MNLFKATMIGEILIARGTITRSQLKMARKFQGPARKLGKALVDDGIMSSSNLDIALGWQLAEAIVGLGYASEKEVFGSLRINVVSERINPVTDGQDIDGCDDKDMEDFSDF